MTLDIRVAVLCVCLAVVALLSLSLCALSAWSHHTTLGRLERTIEREGLSSAALQLCQQGRSRAETKTETYEQWLGVAKQARDVGVGGP